MYDTSENVVRKAGPNYSMFVLLRTVEQLRGGAKSIGRRYRFSSQSMVTAVLVGRSVDSDVPENGRSMDRHIVDYVALVRVCGCYLVNFVRAQLILGDRLTKSSSSRTKGASSALRPVGGSFNRSLDRHAGRNGRHTSNATRTVPGANRLRTALRCIRTKQLFCQADRCCSRSG